MTAELLSRFSQLEARIQELQRAKSNDGKAADELAEMVRQGQGAEFVMKAVGWKALLDADADPEARTRAPGGKVAGMLRFELSVET